MNLSLLLMLNYLSFEANLALGGGWEIPVDILWRVVMLKPRIT